jgi:hypothetical protein
MRRDSERDGRCAREACPLSGFRRTIVTVLSASLMTLAGPMPAQQPRNPQAPSTQRDAEATAGQTKAASAPAPSETSREGHERILGVVPEFETTNRRHPPSLTPGQKFRLFARQSFDPFQWVAAGAQAGISQMRNTWPGYGQGARGYGKRYGAVVADVTGREFFSNFLFPVFLRQDPRYFRLGQGTIRRRIIYSLEQEFSAKTDQGGRQLNFPRCWAPRPPRRYRTRTIPPRIAAWR